MLGLGNLLTKSGVIKKFPYDFSFNFDGSNDYLEIENNSALEPSAEVTVSAWAYMDNWSGASDSRIISNTESGGYALTIDVSNDNNITFYVNNGTWLTPDYALSNLSSGWHHVCGTYKNKTAKLYIDGSLVDTDTNTNNTNITYGSNINFFVGGEPDGSNNVTKFFNGKVDEVSVFDAELSASDVAKIGSKPVDFSKASTYATDRTSNLKLWLRAGDKALPEEDASIARQDFYTDFDGADDYIDCGDIDTSGNFSFSCWFNADSVTGHHMIFSMSDQSTSDGMSCGFFSGKGGKIYATANHGSTSSTKITSVLSTGQWYHLVVTKSSGQTENIYINGVSDTNSADTNWGLADETVIGSRNAGSNFLFNGKISNVTL